MTQRSYVRRVVTIAFSVTLAWAASAFAQKVTTEFDDTVDFSKFKTFAVRDGQMNSPSPVLQGELTRKRIITAIQRALTAKGLTKVDGASDVNVFFLLGSRATAERQETPGLGGRVRIERVPVTEGNVIISLRDPKTRAQVWRGIATDERANPVDLLKKIDDMVKKIVDKYPPKK